MAPEVMNEGEYFGKVIADVLFDYGDEVGEMSKIYCRTIRLGHSDHTEESRNDLEETSGRLRFPRAHLWKKRDAAQTLSSEYQHDRLDCFGMVIFEICVDEDVDE